MNTLRAATPRVNIVVTCYNGIEYSKLTIERIFQTTKTPYYLTIVDNHSVDGTREYLNNLQSPSEYCKDLTIILNDQNIGAGSAHNQGWRISQHLQAEFTCLCDNDLYFWDGWLESLLKQMDDNEDIGAIGPLRISKNTKHYLAPDSKSFFETTPSNLSPIEELEYFFGNGKIEQGLEKFISVNNDGLKKFDQIPASMPAHCLLVRTNTLDRIGFAADPIYKMYGTDDIDLCWEILKQGKIIATDMSSYVHHFRHKSVIDSGLNRDEILRYNNLQFSNKWRLEIDNIRADKLFHKRLTDSSNESYSILRHMTLQESTPHNQSVVLAVWGCLGKTTFAQIYPNLAIDLDSSHYQYDYMNKVEGIEKMKGLEGRTPHPDYPQNYALDIEQALGKFRFILIAIAPEMLHELEDMKIKYHIVYPRSTRKNRILEDAKTRGNNESFIQKLDSILSDDSELIRLKHTRKYEKIHFLNDDEYLEDFIKKEFSH